MADYLLKSCGLLPTKASREKLRQAAKNELRTKDNFGYWLPHVSPTWCWDWLHLVYIRQHLDKLTRGEIDRLMLFVPPRHGKSEMVTVRYPVWRLERNPSMRVIIGAYNQILANKFSRKSRKIARERLDLSHERAAVDDWETAEGGGLRAVGVGSGVTGQGGDLIVIDDPVKNREEANSPTYRERVWEWYTDDLYTRLEPNAKMLLIMTRWHHDDLAGRILESEDATSWTVIRLPALAEDNDPLDRERGQALCPQRYDEKALARIKRVTRSFSALYQQSPSEDEGDTFKVEWFRHYEPANPPAFDYTIQSWDTAFEQTKGAAYSAATNWGHGRQGAVLLDAWREKLDWPGLVLAIGLYYIIAPARPRRVLIEKAASGRSSIQQWRQGKAREDLVKECRAYLDRADAKPAVVGLIRRFFEILPTVPAMIHVPVVPWGMSKGGKLAQADDASAWYQAGQVWHPANASWLEQYELEFVQFPNGRYADWVDCSSQAVLSLLGPGHSHGGSASVQDR